MVFDNTGNTPDFRRTKPAACLQPNGGEPELRNIVISLHMHVTGFLPIAGIEEKPVRPLPQYCRHLPPRWTYAAHPTAFAKFTQAALQRVQKRCLNTPVPSLANHHKNAEAVNLTGSNGIGYLHGSRRSHPILSY